MRPHQSFIFIKNGEQIVRVSGTAVFVKDRMVGKLSGDETKTMLMVKKMYCREGCWLWMISGGESGVFPGDCLQSNQAEAQNGGWQAPDADPYCNQDRAG
ncbi:Ger(x)C family spore germination C-terminal domain-containing protein [Paenibacillus rhizoplanae]